ncbi:hypothetical protein BOTBODRAFT_71641, partial [Botryobasidium botryosum FD-172 SS1]
YDGTVNFNQFERWTFNIDSYFTLTGVEEENMCVLHIMTFLTGKAADWYLDYVLPNVQQYDIKRIYRDLFDYCFSPEFRVEMRHKFKKSKQGQRSVKDYIHDLRNLAKRLPDKTERNITIQFWDGVVPYLCTKLAEGGYNAELTSLDEMLEAAE